LGLIQQIPRAVSVLNGIVGRELALIIQAKILICKKDYFVLLNVADGHMTFGNGAQEVTLARTIHSRDD
jgi:hypothetical protein